MPNHASMESMTGFGSAQLDHALGSITIDIASVNNKQARVSIRSELRDLALEDRLRKQVEQGLGRGSIQVQVRFQKQDALGFDAGQVLDAYQQLQDLAFQAGAPQPTLDLALRYAQQHSSGVSEELSAAVQQVCKEAIAACKDMRLVEGAALTQAMQQASQQLRQIRADLADQAALRPAAQAERLQQRLQELCQQLSNDEIDQTTLTRELAVYADRVDVTEEMVRLTSHLDQLDQLLAADHMVGKKIEFLLQEIGRELNTTGSKANDAQVQQLVIDGKHLLDQLKEQAANCC